MIIPIKITPLTRRGRLRMAVKFLKIATNMLCGHACVINFVVTKHCPLDGVPCDRVSEQGAFSTQKSSD